jgi:hypothetical protein
VVLVAQQRDVDLSETAVPPAGIRPRKQAVLGVGGREHDLCVARLKVGRALAEGDDLGGAHEGPRHGDEAQDEPLLGRRELREGDVCERRRQWWCGAVRVGWRLAGRLELGLGL